MRVSGLISNKMLPIYARESLLSFLSENDGKQFTLTASAGKKRSNKQNAYYWGVVIPIIMQMIRSQDCTVDEDVAHEFLKRQFPQRHVTVYAVNGVARQVPIGTSRYTTREFETYVLAITAFAAENGFIVPSPRESGYSYR